MEELRQDQPPRAGVRQRVGFLVLAGLVLAALALLSLWDRSPSGGASTPVTGGPATDPAAEEQGAAPLDTGGPPDGGGAARSAGAPVPPVPSRPLNVLFVLTDQLNARTTSTYGNGYGGLEQPLTPNLDRLAAEGARFDSAICATPQCAPSRFTLFTGQWPFRHGLHWNRVWEPRGPVTIATLAREAGYATAHIGKHHMMWLDQPESGVDHGFDVVIDRDDYKAHCGAHGQKHHAAPGNAWCMPRMEGRLLQTGYTYNTNEFHPSGYFADRVIEFLEARAGEGGDGKPFLVWFSTPGPHTPLLPSGPEDPNDWAHRFHPPEKISLPPNLRRPATTVRLQIQQALMEHISDDEWRQVLSYYYGLIAQIDFNVGRVLDALDDLGLAEDTLVVFTADHGEMASEMACWSKGTGSYDAINRVPLVVRLPGRVVGGKVIEEPTSNVDLMPTLLELTGIPVPGAVQAKIDGRSLAPLLLDEEPGAWPEGAFSLFGTGVTRTRMVRTATDKFSFDDRGKGGRGQAEYFDLVADPFEMNDLIDDPGSQERIAHLRGMLEAWWEEVEAAGPLHEVVGEAEGVPVSTQPLFPRDGAKAMPRDVDLVWLPCTAADRQRVYFGEDEDPPVLRELGTMVERCNLGTLAAHTTYYWRVESINANGSHPGTVASFRTGTRGEVGPGLASQPVPDHGASRLPRAIALEWQPAPGAEGQLLSVGEDGPPSQVAELPADAASYAIEASAGVEVRWRVDSVGPEGVTRGDEWAFETDSTGLPAWPAWIAPEHLAQDVASAREPGEEELPPGSLRLRWTRVRGAARYQVFLGTSHPLTPIGKGPRSEIVATGLERGQAYLWRVDAINAAGRRQGWTWRFVY